MPIPTWERAQKVIPGGNSLISKRPYLFAPNDWPTYFSKAKGCSVWDLEGTTTDMRGNEREMLEHRLNKNILVEPWYNEGVGGIKPFFSPGNLYVITYADFMSLMKNMPRFINWTKTKPFK